MKRRQHGTAIIAALLIVSIVSIIATGLALRLQIEIHRTESEFFYRLYYCDRGSKHDGHADLQKCHTVSQQRQHR